MGNTFRVQLSDSGGAFTNPVVIGSLQSTNSGIIACKLPFNMLTSSGYQIRVMSDSPAVISYYLNQPITIYATPQAGAGVDTLVCSGQPIPLQAQGGASYQWLPGSLVTDSTGSATVFRTPVNGGVATQSFLIKLVAVAASGCSDTDTVVILVKPKPVLHIPPDTTLCHGQTLVLKATGSGGDSTAYVYSWSNALGQIESVKDTLTVVADTSKSMLIKLTDGCSQPGDSVVWQLQVLPSLKLTGATDTIVCEGGIVTYNLTVFGGNGTAACYWSDGFIGTNRNIAIATSILSYTIIVADGCSDSVIKTITITPELNPVVKLTATPDSGCISLQVVMRNATGNNSTTTYYWDKGDGNIQVNSDTFMLTTYTASGSYSPTLILKSKRGCTGAQTLINGVTALPKPNAALSVNYDTTWITFPELTFTNQSTGADTFRWHFDDGSSDTVLNTLGTIIHSFTNSGRFEVQLVAQNTFGCTDTARQKIVVLQDFDVWIPNAFTPGTDSLNNTFYPMGVGIREYKLFIYNRWGQQVFESKGKLDQWNGCLQNELNAPLPDGTYGYYIELRNYKGRGYMYKGSVTLLR
jgi:gliding motility-associated-like protein